MTAGQGPGRRSDGVTTLGYASFILIGWSALLVPALVPAIERDFTQSDAGVGVLYLASSLLFVLGSLASGYLMERLGRGLVLPAAVLALGMGLGVECLAPSWVLFVLGAGISGLGSGSVEVGVNGLFLDRFHEDRGRAMNRLHLCYSVGALAAPLAVGAVVEVGVAWRVPFAVTSALVVAVALRLVTRDLGTPGVALSGPSLRGLGARRVPLPLVLLAVAIACYVASENGVSSWLVRFLKDAPVGVSTAALSVFWAGLTGGRIVASRFAGRFAPIAVATACVFAAGVAIVTAVAVPWVGASIALFGAAGFRLRPCLPDDHGLGGRALPGAIERGERDPHRRGRDRVGRLPARDGIRLEQRRARRRDGRRGADRVRLRRRPARTARARTRIRYAGRRAGSASRVGIDSADAIPLTGAGRRRSVVNT